MGEDLDKQFNELIERMRGFNNDPKIVDQRVKAIIITKLEEAKLWSTKINPS